MANFEIGLERFLLKLERGLRTQINHGYAVVYPSIVDVTPSCSSLRKRHYSEVAL